MAFGSPVAGNNNNLTVEQIYSQKLTGNFFGRNFYDGVPGAPERTPAALHLQGAQAPLRNLAPIALFQGGGAQAAMNNLHLHDFQPLGINAGEEVPDELNLDINPYQNIGAIPNDFLQRQIGQAVQVVPEAIDYNPGEVMDDRP